MLTRTEISTLQPTLSLYLGGSGIAAGKSLLTLIENLKPDERQLIEPFFIDSQEPAVEDHERARHYCYRNVYQFEQPIFKEFHEHRFPENIGDHPVVDSSQGCGITRIFGAASLVNCRDDFSSLVEQACARLRERRTSPTQPLQVFLTASACGGTGAGMILDAAALLRHYFRERGESPRIFFFLVGPTVYLDDPSVPLRQDQRDRMRASTYALVKELHHFAADHEFRSAYRLRDQVISIGNTRDDDRLFDWVYYIDGRPESAGGSTRSLAEVAWTIAEAQLHLCVTEVGRKISELLPNQREERVRGYASEFIHADNKDLLSEDTRKRLETGSRKTFLASFGVRNVRFPAEEIKDWFRWGWVREALEHALNGKPRRREQQPVDEFDTILGFSDGAIQPDGLLAELGLVRDDLLSRVQSDADPGKGLPPAPGPSTLPDRAVDLAKKFLEAARATIDDLKRDASLVAPRAADSGTIVSAATLLANALPGWQSVWDEGLRDGGAIAARLWDLAWEPATGRGLHFLNDLLSRAARVLEDQAAATSKRPSMTSLADAVNAAESRLGGLMQKQRLEQRGWRAMGRSLLVHLKIAPSPHSGAFTQTLSGIARDLESLRKQLIAHRTAYVANALAPRAWVIAATELKRWRDEVLAPAITAAENASTLANNNWRLARVALRKYRGSNARGRWEAYTTRLIASDTLLKELGEHVAKVSAEDVVLTPLHGNGLARDCHRLTSKTLSSLDRSTTIEILFQHVKAMTAGALTFLDNGWMLPQVARELHGSAAEALDEGAEPLVSFSRAAVGQQLQSYLLAPPSLILPDVFGRTLGRMNRLVSTDPLQLGVVSFIYGIPPNALDGMHELFAQYAAHIGDQERNKAPDRYPMHIFREAPEKFDEPHSPLDTQTHQTLVTEVVDAAHQVWDAHGGIRLRIRPWNETASPNTNCQIELIELLLRYLLRQPDKAEALFANGRYRALARLYDRRRYRNQNEPAPDENPRQS
ncbi:MAG: hypothetical protein JO197_02155 [Acidobacteria bacterium]|nr:hypothetical protein [Acidobacteriota bacterium]MBV9476817.1 hypothetical protein [Acidobacteriota bacterium]